jgi:hypothetical protein
MTCLNRGNQAGGIMIEFALAFSLFCVAFLAVVEFSRLSLTWGAAAEATRRGARLASICEFGANQASLIRSQVRPLLTSSGQVDLGQRTDWLVIDYLPLGCGPDSCTMVDVRLNAVSVSLMVPGFSNAIPLPAFPARLTREAMRNSTADGSNASCA